MPLTITTGNAGEIVYRFPNGGVFDLPALPDAERQSLPGLSFTAAAGVLGDYLDQARAIANDADLSDAGRAKRIEPLQQKVVLQVAHADGQLDREQAHFADREAKLLAVPRLEPTAGAIAVEDAEVRSWWRGLSLAERNDMLARIEKEPGHERLMIALLRAPVAMHLDREVEHVRNVWARARRLDNPGEAVAIDRGRAAIGWAKRGLAHVAALTSMALKWDPDRIVRTTLASADPAHHGGHKAFGIDAMTVERVKRTLAHESQQRART